MLTSSIAEALDLGFRVDGFWTAVLGSIIISVVSTIVGAVVEDDR
jgi:putative membrane protein